MRNEQEIMELVLQTAQQDDRIRAVTMNGSRSDPNAAKDRFQDYDIVFFVTELSSFLSQPDWIDCFGERVILQTPEDMELFPPSLGGWFTYLMLFEDLNRIDLMLIPVSDVARYAEQGEPTVPLLDKDGILPKFPAPSDQAFWVKRPSRQCFLDCCNEFWWLAPYVAKGIARKELFYASEHLSSMRKQLMTMISWKVGAFNHFQVSVGKMGRYLPRYLTEEELAPVYSALRADSLEHCRESLEKLLDLFSQYSKWVSKELSYPYPDHEEKVTAYLKRLSFFNDTNR